MIKRRTIIIYRDTVVFFNFVFFFREYRTETCILKKKKIISGSCPHIFDILRVIGKKNIHKMMTEYFREVEFTQRR